MDYYKKFMNRDLPIGQKYEEWYAINHLSGNYTTNDDSKYDIKSDNITYEVKTDKLCFVYYRFGFEISSRGKLSGINTTQADKWVTIVPVFNKIIIMDINDIKNFIKKHKENSVLRPAGDGKSSKMILWDWNYFMKNFINKEVISNINIPNYYGKKSFDELIKTIKKYIDKEECKYRRLEDSEIDTHYKKLIKKLC